MRYPLIKGGGGFSRFWNVGAAAFIREFQDSPVGMMRSIDMTICD